MAICDRLAINASCDCLTAAKHDRPLRGRPNRRATGGRGRIRTFVARKERQIYSLLVLATHPPVPRKQPRRQVLVPSKVFLQIPNSGNETQKGLVSERHQPLYFSRKDLLRLTPLPITKRTFWWSWRRELNPRPSDYKSDALPAELRQHRANRVRIAEGARKLQGAKETWSKWRAKSVENHFPCVALPS
jgi:hypothetical protein